MTDLDPISDGTLACPVPSPSTSDPCVKKIPNGWHASEGHAGGHWWMPDRVRQMMNGGHYDATKALAGEPFDGHLPEECPGAECPYLLYLPRSRR